MQFYDNENDKRMIEMLLAQDVKDEAVRKEISLKGIQEVLGIFTIEEKVMLFICWEDDLNGTSIQLLMHASELADGRQRKCFLDLITKMMLSVPGESCDLFYEELEKQVMEDPRTIWITLDIAKNGNPCPMAGPVEGGFDWIS